MTPSFKVNDADRNRKNAGMLSGLTYLFSLDKTLVIACLIAALLIYLYTGQIVIAIFIVPPLIHYILKKRMGNNDGY